MSLRTKALIILGIFFVLYGAIDYGIHRLYILPQFLTIEREEAQKNLNRCMAALDREIKNLDQTTNDWAAWDDSCEFMKNINKNEYIETNLLVKTFTDNRINLIWFLNTDGTKEWGNFVSMKNEEPRPAFSLGDTRPFLVNNKEGHIRGISKIDSRLFIISCRPIISSDREGPVHGTLVMGRVLDDEYIAQIATQTSTDMKLDIITEEKSAAEENDSTSFLKISGTYPDIHGNHLIKITIKYFRNIATKGDAIIKESILMTLLAGSFLSIALLSMMRTSIIIPIKRLTVHATDIRETGQLIPVSGYDDNGEIGLLYGAFASMLNELRGTHTELEKRVEGRTKKLETLNEKLKSEVNRRIETEEKLKKAKQNLEETVLERTRKLIATNQKLTEEIEERLKSEISLRIYHEKLIRMTSELTIAEERERRKIATGLHDCIGQTLTVAKMKVDLVSKKAEDEEIRKSATSISSMLEQAISDTRNFTFRLSPPVLHELGLTAGLEWLAEYAENEYGLTVIFEKNNFTVEIDETIKITAFQAAKELVFNAFKHAEASIIKIGLTMTEKKLILFVEDNGKGFDYHPASLQSHSKGFGLFSITERLSHSGGRISVVSGEGQGSKITIIIPTA